MKKQLKLTALYKKLSRDNGHTKGLLVMISTTIVLILLSQLHTSSYPDPINASSIITYVPQLHNGDAKFYNNKIITNVNGKLSLYDLDGNEFKSYDSVNAYWIDVLPEENIVIYGNFNPEIGIVQFDKNYNLLSQKIILKGTLMIDPTIIKKGNSFYITVTQIEGTVNNADKKTENGRYSIQLYKSNDLKNWSYINTAISCLNNLEDIDFFYTDNKFYLSYEKEQLDKGLSSICIIESMDGSEWNTPKELLPADSDHEPATLTKTHNNEFKLYYSCDKDDVGSSYMGSKIYYALFDKNFNLVKKDIPITSQTNRGILLYDVQLTENTERFLFAKNYLSDNDMVIEEKAK